MKKIFVSLLLVLALVSSLFVSSASADVVTNLGTINAGENFSQIIYQAPALFTAYMADVNGDGTPDFALPQGLSLSLESSADPATGTAQCALRLSGIPTIAGSYSFAITVDFGDGTYDSVQCSVIIYAATPGLSVCPDQICDTGSNATVSVDVFATDNGVLSYQWYSNTVRSTEGGIMIPGAVDASYSFAVEATGETYYYCIVTNTNNGYAASAISPVTKVSVRSVSTIALSAFPTKMSYVEDDEVDLTGLQITAIFSDGSTALITDVSKFEFAPKKVTTVGFEIVKISFGGQSIDLPVQVEKGKEEIEVVRMPSKVSYKVGEALDTTGLTVRVFNASGYNDVTTGFSCSPTILTRTGQQTITVIYNNGESTTFTVYVEAAKVEEKLEISSRPIKLEYTVGDKIDTTGLELKFWSGTDGRTVTSGYTCSPSVFNQASESQTVTVQYNGKTATFTVTVKEKAPETTPVVVTPAPTAIIVEPEDPKPTEPVKPTKSSNAPVAVVIIAIIIAGAALAGATVYLVMLKRSNEEEYESDIEFDEPEQPAEWQVPAGWQAPAEPKVPVEPSVSEEVTPAAPEAPAVEPAAPEIPTAPSGPEATPVNELEPEKKDYFEGLFDDK